VTELELIRAAAHRAARDASIPGERLLDVAEAAVKLGISESGVRRLMAEDPTFPLRRELGERRLFMASELDRWMQSLPVESRIRKAS